MLEALGSIPTTPNKHKQKIYLIKVKPTNHGHLRQQIQRQKAQSQSAVVERLGSDSRSLLGTSSRKYGEKVSNNGIGKTLHVKDPSPQGDTRVGMSWRGARRATLNSAQGVRLALNGLQRQRALGRLRPVTPPPPPAWTREGEGADDADDP